MPTRFAVKDDDIAFNDERKKAFVAQMITTVAEALDTSDAAAGTISTNLQAYAANIRANNNFYRSDLVSLKTSLDAALALASVPGKAKEKVKNILELYREIKEQRITMNAGTLNSIKVDEQTVAAFFREAAEKLPDYQEGFKSLVLAIEEKETVVKHSFLEEAIQCAATCSMQENDPAFSKKLKIFKASCLQNSVVWK